MSYKQFVEDAIENYNALPLESNDIYKKYAVHLPLEYMDSPQQVDTNTDESEIEAFSRKITEKTRIKFDAIVSGHLVKIFNTSLTVVASEKVEMRLLQNKLYKSKDDKLAAFSNAHSTQFIFIDAEEGKTKKLNILFINKGNLSVQVMISTRKNSKLDVFELFVSNSATKSLVTALHEISAGNNSEVELNVLHNEDGNSHIINLCKGVASDDAKLRANFIYGGGAVTKSKAYVESAGIGSQVDVSEFAFGVGSQKFDLGTYLINVKPRSAARLESGTVLSGSAHCMLKGFAKVEKGTKGCFSRITERGILLSKDAHVDALPDMSIDYSNEVKATHSAATAPIDQEALFYLKSRGLEEGVARRIFITAFIAKYISNIKAGIASEVAMSVMLDKLDRGTLGEMPDVTTSGVWMAR